MKEAAVYLSKVDIGWTPKIFGHVLTNALESLALKDI
jgi:hypothetical protein